MSIWVRNFRSTYGSGDDFGRYSLAFYLRELLQVAGYTEHSKSGTGWTENVDATLTDCVVLAASPRVIYSPSAPFTESMVDSVAISLLASNDENRSIWRIKGFIDASHVEVDGIGFHPVGWVDETGITARLTRVDTSFSSTAYCLMDSPVSECRVRVETTSTEVLSSIHPTAQLGDVTPYTDTIAYDGTGEHQRIFHMFADDGDVIIYWNTEKYQECLIICQLEDADTGDSYPWVMFGKARFGSEALEYAWHIPGYCVDSAKAPINAYLVWPQPGWGSQDSSSPLVNFGRRLVNGQPGYAVLHSPWVVLADRAGTGSCTRGRLPWTYLTNVNYEPLRPLDSSGDLLHWYGGLAVPRNGDGDPTPKGISLLVYNPGNVFTSVFHQDVSGEIAGLPSKANPVGADILLIESPADGNAKFGVLIEDLPIKSFRDVEMATGKVVVQPTVAVEEVIGGRVFDGADVGVQDCKFVAMWNPVLSSGTAYVRLYDTGPQAGPPSISVLVAELSAVSSGLVVGEVSLSVSGSGPSLGVIKDTPRTYEVRVTSTDVEGSVTYIHNAYLVVV